MADLVRNLKTEVVHRPGCPSSGSVLGARGGGHDRGVAPVSGIGWLLDHPIVSISAVIVAIAGLIIGLIMSGTLDTTCRKGQTSQFAYFQPMITTINGVTTVTEIPVYTCQAGS